MNCVVNDKDAVFAYFKLINEIEPSSILDIGMFLKRCGAVGRCVMGEEISEDIKLHGIDVKGSMPVGIYDRIYDEQFVTLPDNKYDLVLVMKSVFVREMTENEGFMDWCSNNACILVIDSDVELKGMLPEGTVTRKCSAGVNTYYVVLFRKIDRGE